MFSRIFLKSPIPPTRPFEIPQRPGGPPNAVSIIHTSTYAGWHNSIPASSRQFSYRLVPQSRAGRVRMLTVGREEISISAVTDQARRLLGKTPENGLLPGFFACLAR